MKNTQNVHTVVFQDFHPLLHSINKTKKEFILFIILHTVLYICIIWQLKCKTDPFWKYKPSLWELKPIALSKLRVFVQNGLVLCVSCPLIADLDITWYEELYIRVCCTPIDLKMTAYWTWIFFISSKSSTNNCWYFVQPYVCSISSISCTL